jgi:hypothetical protein
MHGSSGLTGFGSFGLEARWMWFFCCVLGFAVSVFWFLAGWFGGFELALKKDLTGFENAVECIGSTGRIDCPRSLTK